MSNIMFPHVAPWDARKREIEAVAAALHRMNKDDDLAANPVWQQLCADFDRKFGGKTYWDLPF